MMNRHLSIVVLTFSRPDRCADSLRKNRAALSSLSPIWYLINNGGPAVETDAGIHRIELPENQGTSARNRALEQIETPYVLMLDDDAYIEEETVHAALEALDAVLDAGLIMLPVNQEGCLLPTIFHGCAVLFRTEALKQVGGYPDDYLYYGEEYEVSFRLAAAGYQLLPALPQSPPVLHVRDSGGRNKSHIIYRNIRNNSLCWVRHFPLQALGAALFDTLFRYRHVARKEQATAGFRRGLPALAISLLSGFSTRTPLSGEAFEQLTLLTALRALLAETDRVAPLILCGLGKFPSLWLKELVKTGRRPIAILEHNPAFHGRTFRGIPIIPAEQFTNYPSALYLTGTSSLPDAERWNSLLQNNRYQIAASTQLLRLFEQAHTA
jgi:hypothetical protein